MKIGPFGALFLVIGGLLTIAALVIPQWSAPPIEAEQTGYRGTAMAYIGDREVNEALQEVNVAPAPPYPYDPDATDPLSGDFYENVQVLRDVPTAEFNRMMLAITEWIVPEEYRNNPENAGGCNYCHNPANLASDEVYTKNVARTMLVMTRHINANWQDHVGGTGVTCYTCHRGAAVPANIWYEDPDASGMGGFIGTDGPGQNRGGVEANGYASLPYDPFTPYLLEDPQRIRVLDEVMITAEKGASIQETEQTYALMMHMSTSLGVNCTHCHNSRSVAVWEASTPMRATSWYALQMVPDINASYILPTADWLPEHRKGPTGQPFSVNCATCHNGVNKPLYGAPMAQDWPYLQSPPSAYWPARGSDEASLTPAERLRAATSEAG